jgi:transcriptional regulator with XRE-family HTH domain
VDPNIPFCYGVAMSRDDDLLEQFGKRVRELRKAAGFSQESFAAKCGLDRTYIGGIERGERNVALRNIRVIASALGISISQLMNKL